MASFKWSVFIFLFINANAALAQRYPECVAGTFWNECFGEKTYPNGDRYLGDWKNGKRDGIGVLFLNRLVQGGRQIGEWRNDLPHGRAVLLFPNRPAVEGIWEAGVLVQNSSVNWGEFSIEPVRTTNLQPTAPSVQTAQVSASGSDMGERDRLAAEVATERKKRQELEQLLAQAQQSRQQIQGSSITNQRLNAHALVIGNSAYPGALRLPNPVNDARAMSSKLRSMGFIVTEVGDANRARLVQALGQFNRSAANADLTLLFYSGHGVQILGTNFILPTDVDQSDVAQATIQGISLNSVVEQFMPGPTKVVFLDACRDNPLAMSNTRTVSRGLAPISVSQGTLIAYATKDGQTALDGLPGQSLSPFTSALLEHLGDPDDIAVVLRKVRDRVMKSTGGKQQPWDYGSLSGGALVLSSIKK